MTTLKTELKSDELKVVTSIDNFLSDVFKIICDDVRKSPTLNAQWEEVLAQAEQLKEGYRKDYKTFQNLLDLFNDDGDDGDDNSKTINTEAGSRIVVPVGAVEFNVNSNTIWVQSNLGATTMRIRCNGKINVDKCENSPVSHCDIMVDGDINFCLSNDAKNG